MAIMDYLDERPDVHRILKFGYGLTQHCLSDMAVNGTFGVSMISKGYTTLRPMPSNGNDVLMMSEVDPDRGTAGGAH
jgi:hypothetical protein